MAALKKLGVKAAVGFSAVGSLREEVKPRDFLVAGGVVDWTKGVGWTLRERIGAHEELTTRSEIRYAHGHSSRTAW